MHVINYIYQETFASFNRQQLLRFVEFYRNEFLFNNLIKIQFELDCFVNNI